MTSVSRLASLALQPAADELAEHRDLAVAVFVEDGTSGSGTAGPILEQFLRAA